MSGNHYCYGCLYYKPYYIKEIKEFEKLDIGKCCKKKLTVNKREVCEYYSNKHYNRVDIKKVACKVIVENIEILAEIKQILEEDNEEELEQIFFEMRKRKELKRK